MERTKRIVIMTLLLAVSLFKLSAQYKHDIYNAYINSNMDAWKTLIDVLELKDDKSDALLLELINYQYGYIGFCIENDDKKQAKSYLKLAENNLERLEKSSFNPSSIHAYKSAFYGFSIGLNKLKAPFVGPKSVEEAKVSMELNPLNPLGFIQYANAQFYMPAVFGGSKTEAVKYYKKAQSIIENSPTMVKHDWNYLNLLVNIAKSYTEMKEYDKADGYYQLILKVEPNFLAVKNELYPTFLKNKNNE